MLPFSLFIDVETVLQIYFWGQGSPYFLKKAAFYREGAGHLLFIYGEHLFPEFIRKEMLFVTSLLLSYTST